MKSGNEPKLSVVLPVYNAEKYLAQTLDSVINQSIDFTTSIKIVAVDDGSSDGSAAILSEFKNRFPENMHIITQKNAGVSAARNCALEEVTTEFVTFLDSDDLWSRNAFAEMIRFLEVNNEVDFVAARIKFFEADIGSHPSNYKFSSTRVIDVTADPDNPILHLPTCVFRASAVQKFKFDDRLKISEDAKFLSQILHEKKAYGVVSDPVYHYRKRYDGSSAIGGQAGNREYYQVTPRLAYEHMLDLWRSEDGGVEKFMQYTILSDLYWRVTQRSQAVLSDQEEQDYKNVIRNIVRRIDDDVIMTRHGLSVELRLFFLKMKHGDKAVETKLRVTKNNLYYDYWLLCRADDVLVVFDFIKDEDPNKVKIEGHVLPGCAEVASRIQLHTTSGSPQKLERVSREHLRTMFLGDEVASGGAFESTMEIGRKDAIYTTFGKESPRLKLESEKFSGLSRLSFSYSRKGGALVRKFARHITVMPYSWWRCWVYEVIFLARILGNWRLTRGVEHLRKLKEKNLTHLGAKARLFELLKPLFVVAEAVMTIPRAIFLRCAYKLYRPAIKRPIWLISDRTMAAGDNGEALFRYIMSRENVPADVYFVLSKKSKDFARMQKYGKVLDQSGLRYKLLFLLSDKVISSHADIDVINPFLRQIDHYVDLYSFDFIFLQHGVTYGDGSPWLHKFEKNINLFITSGKAEYESILQYPYYYRKDNILLSGMPRYDLLTNDPKNKIIIAPTHRAALLQSGINKQGQRSYDGRFKYSSYFRFYQSLIEDDRFISLLKENGLTAEFYVHPNFASQVRDFKGNEVVSVVSYPYDYRKALSEGSLLITDFSSVAFDFAYLRKPVLYAQFDSEEFYAGQVYDKGYFDFPVDGFGPVCYTLDELVGSVSSVVGNNCKLTEKYATRVNGFFAFNDQKASKRVYEVIVKQ